MALCRFAVKHRGRSVLGPGVARHIAYIMREEEYGPAAAHLAYVLRDSARVRSREDLIHTETANLPAWAQGSAAVFFEAADRYERRNGRVATTWEIALPRELSRAQQLACARDFLHSTLGTTHPYAWAMHESHASDGQTNPHIHVVFSERTLDGFERGPQQFFRRYDPTDPARGGAKKDRDLHHRDAVGVQRELFTDIANLYLEEAGSAARLDPRTLSARGIERDPEARLAPYHSTQLKYQGGLTPEWADTLTAREQRASGKAAEEAKAFAYWEQRKVTLGLTPELTHAEALERITAHERQAPPRRTLEQLYAEQATHLAEIAALEHYGARLDAAIMIATHYERTGTQPSPAAQRRLEAVFQEGIALGLGGDEDYALHQGARFRFKERSAARGRGTGYEW